MARLWQCGFELNSTTAGVEFDSITGAPTIQTSVVLHGAYALQANPSATTAFLTHQYAGTGNTNNTYVRAYIRFASFPTANNISILLIRSAAAGNNVIIHADTNGALSITNEQAASVQVGNKTGGLLLNTWYRVELSYTYATGAVSGFLAIGDGTSTPFGVGTANASIDTNTIRLGAIDSATMNMYADNVAINDDTGTSQNSIPGPGAIVHLKPNAAGDSNGFTVQVGGTAGAANNFTRVQETTPDDATTYNAAALLNAEDLFNVDNFTGGAFSSINVVAVGVRMADLVAGDATTGVKLEIEKTASGTKTQSANLIPNSTSFLTNTATAPRNYPLITYTNPDGGAWTQAFLDSMQIGYINDTVGVQSVAISTIWVSIDYTQAAYGTTTSTSSTSASTTSTSISSTSSSTSSTSTSFSSTSTSLSTSSTSYSMSITTGSTSSTSSSISSTSISSTSASTSISSTSSSISSTSVSSTSMSSTSSSSSISSTSSSISSTSSSISSTSASTSSTSFSSTSSSSSTSTTAIPTNLIYSYQDQAQFTTIRQFTKTGAWVCPAGVTSVKVECWGGGASGGATTAGDAGGGGGGAYARLNALAVTAGTSYTVTVGTGGAAKSPTGNGNAGNDSWFSTSATVLAKAGSGGLQSGSGGSGGAGGLASGSIGDVTFDGGTGGADTAGNLGGGGGGGGAGDSSPGGVGGVSSVGTGGAAGRMGATTGGTGGAGAGSAGTGPPGRAIGGGGGGAATTSGGASGAGAAGMVQLTYTVTGVPPTTGVSVTNNFSNVNASDVDGDDGDYFIEYGSEYMIREYKKKWINNTDVPTFTWRGRSTVSTIVSPMLVQIYNQNSAAWETLAVANKVPADTDFSVTVSQTTNVSNYYDSNLIVTFRSYQLVV